MRKTMRNIKNNETYLFKATEFIEPLIVKGNGCYVWDTNGNKYLDLNSGQFSATFGHNYKPLNKIVSEQMKKIHHTNTMVLTPEVYEAAQKMASINSKDLSKTIFLSTGAEANECAIRYAKFISNKEMVISLSKGYHGLTHALQNLTMSGEWAIPKVSTYRNSITPDLLYKEMDISDDEYIKFCLNNLKQLLEENKNKIAAIIMELILGVGGMIILPKEYVKEVRKLCTENDIILIVDECQTGFGRTGHWFAYQYYGIIPDIVVSAKSMGAGLPVSAVTFKKELVEKIEGKITHFSSHQNEPLSARVVSFVIDTIIENNILEKNRVIGKYLLDELMNISKKTSLLINPRAVGLMVAFDLPIQMVEKTRRKITEDLIKLLLEKGVLIQAIRKGVTFRIIPSYIIEKRDIDFFLKKLEESLHELEKKY